MEATSHFGHFLQSVLLPAGFGSIDSVIVERLTGQRHNLHTHSTLSSLYNSFTPRVSASDRWTPPPHLGLWDDTQAELLVDKRGGRLGEVALVGDEAAAAEAAGAAQLVEVFGPLGVQVTVRLLRLGLEHADGLLRGQTRS